MTLTQQLKNEINNNYKDSLFTIKDFLNLGKYDTIKRLLIRFEKENYINRVIDGIYHKPKYSKLTNELVPINPNDLANKIADMYSWKIAPTGNFALNLIGLSEQVPTNYEYLSTGPYRSYHYGNKTIKFNNTRSNEINDLDDDIILIINAIKAIGKENINEKTIKKLRKYIEVNKCQDILNQTSKITNWVYEVIKEVCSYDQIS